MTKTMRRLGTAAALALGTGAAGCAQLGGLENVLGGVMNPNGAGGNVAAEVRYVDDRRQTIEFETNDRRVGTVYYDDRTRVVYQNQDYRPTALEAGDQVTMRVQQDSRGNAYTDYIVVTRSVSTSSSGGGYSTVDYGLQTLSGDVGRVDTQRGMFELRMQNGQYVWVSLPYNAHSSDVDRFRRLRGGEYVRISARVLSQDRVELDRFM